MASYYEAIERALPRNCSADWVAVNKYVDDALQGTNASLISQIKSDLLKAANLMENASDISAATASFLMMDPLESFQVCEPHFIR